MIDIITIGVIEWAASFYQIPTSHDKTVPLNYAISVLSKPAHSVQVNANTT